MLLLTTCKNLYSYAARLALGAATSPTMAERTNLCPDQGKRDQPMSENMTCQAQVLFLCREVTFRSDLPEEPAAFSRAPSHTTCVARHICQAEGTKSVVATSEQKPSALVVGWSSSSCANRRKNLLLRKQKGKPCFPMMDPSLRCSLSSCMTP